MASEERWMDEGFWVWTIFRIIFAIIIASIVFGFIFNFAFQQSMMFNTDWFWNLVGLLALIWLISWIFRWPWRHRYWDLGFGHEMRILRRRYARGEITEAQFKKMMKVLREESRRAD